jgi:WD40-like Beta Propeller Repeat
MRTSLDRFAAILFLTLWLTATLILGGFAQAQTSATAKGGKTPPPPPNISRPICFAGSVQKGSYVGILRSDVNGSSIIAVNQDIRDSWPRWSPDGLLIGGYRKWLGGPKDSLNNDNLYALMVMSPDGANEQLVMTGAQFNAWNLSRPGVLASKYDLQSYECWLGTNAFVFTAKTTYDAALFGGTPGETISRYSLFIVDAAGTITPLTETATLGVTEGDCDFSPHWSAALDKVVFVGGYLLSPPQELFAINPDGTGLQQITDNFRPEGSLLIDQAVWSPTGDRLALSVEDYHDGHYFDELWILGVDLSQPNPGMGDGGRVTSLQVFKSGYPTQYDLPAWSADGTRLLFYKSDADGKRIVIADVATGAETIVASSKGYLGGADWDPLDLP